MKSEGNRECLAFSLGELLKDDNIRLANFDSMQLNKKSTNLKRIIIPADLDVDLAQKIANQIGLTFISERDQSENVCMAESSEVLPAFREICTGTDILNYILAVLNSEESSEMLKNQEKLNSFRITLEKDAEEFWKQVEMGRRVEIFLCKEFYETEK